MNAAERDAYQLDLIARSDKQTGKIVNVVGWGANNVAMFACDYQGVKIFGPKDVKELNETDEPESLDAVFDAILEFNGLTRMAQEEQEGNSEGETGGGSSAGSPSNSLNLQFDTFLDGSKVTTLASG